MRRPLQRFGILVALALAACNEDPLVAGQMNSSDVDGGNKLPPISPSVCAAALDSVTCLQQHSGCSWLHMVDNFGCFDTSCTSSCAGLDRSDCLSCFGCTWSDTQGTCGPSMLPGQAPCSAAPDSDFCLHAVDRTGCAWITTQSGPQCVQGFQGSKS